VALFPKDPNLRKALGNRNMASVIGGVIEVNHFDGHRLREARRDSGEQVVLPVTTCDDDACGYF
jgi:hypothetical protein